MSNDKKGRSEAPSELVAEARLRHEHADSDLATPQEKRQAEVEKGNASDARPDGSDAQVHETSEPTVAVADEDRVKQLRKQQESAREALAGSEPVNSPAGVRREEKAADARTRDADKGSQK